METLIYPVLGLSLAANAALVFALLFKRLAPKPTLTQDARDFLHDLTAKGRAVVSVQLVDAANLFLRSPRE